MSKKLFLAVAVGLGLVMGLAGISEAINPANVTVKFTVQNLSISLSTSQVQFGIISPGSFFVAFGSIVVTNDGNGDETFQLQTTTYTVPGNFQLVISSPAASNQFRVLGVFNNFQPMSGDFDVVNDPITEFFQSADTFRFAGNETGSFVPAASSRSLWLRLDTPTGSPVGGEQLFTITINAMMP